MFPPEDSSGNPKKETVPCMLLKLFTETLTGPLGRIESRDPAHGSGQDGRHPQEQENAVKAGVRRQAAFS